MERIREVGLDALDFDWTGDIPSRNVVDGLLYRPLDHAHFDFIFGGGDWGFDYAPGLGVPQAGAWVGHWIAELGALDQWLEVCRAEVDAPDLWRALERERDAFVRPADDRGNNEPFRTEEVEAIAQEMAALKAYVREAFELPQEQLREIDAKLDYLAQAAGRAPSRIDWWNQAVGAIINLALTAVVQPHVAQGLLSMAAHGLSHLFGGGAPQLGS